MKSCILTLLILSAPISFTYAQVFSGFETYKRLMEYQAQRYLMAEVFEIPSNEPIELALKRVFHYENNDEGFMFTMVAYKIRGQKGAIISAFNSTSFNNDQYQFVNLHLRDDEVLAMNAQMMSLLAQDISPYKKLLKQYNSRVILEATVQIRGGREFPACALWIDRDTRHTFLQSAWEDLIKAYQSF